MEDFRWQWRLANGGTVTAVIAEDKERVTQGPRVLSEAARATLPEHVVTVSPERSLGSSERPPLEATLAFAPTTPICILRVDGHEVSPILWPTRRRPSIPVEAPRSFGNVLIAGVAIALLIALGLWIRNRGDHGTGRFDGTKRAPSGLFIAHYPEDLAPSPALLPEGTDGIVIENKEKSTVVIIAALAHPSPDPWTLQQSMHDELLANVPKSTAHYREDSRRDEICAGQRGAIVTGYLTADDGARQARIWSCAFAQGETGYIALTMLSEPASALEDKRAKAIVDATELTHLAATTR